MTTTELPLTTTTDQHTADTTTGGESIFSSDGLAPLPIPPPPAFFYSKQKNKTATTNNNDNDETKEEDDGELNDNACVLDSETSDPMQAFEIFQGRIFAPRGLGGGTGSTGGRTKATAESTMMRLARIERELKEMESESSKSLERQQQQQQQRDDGDGDIDENDGAVRKVVEELSKRLVQLQDSSTGGGSTSGATRQNELTSLVRKEMDKLAAQTGSSLSSTKDDSGAASSETKEGSSGRVVYELYGNGSNNTSHRSSSTTAITNEQEERLNRIEAFLGSSSTSASTSSVVASHYDGKSSLLERLTQVEETLKSVDGNVLDNAAARAKVIRADLEAAAKARNKISSSANPEDTKTISTLHNTLLDFDGFLSSNTLSIIVQRLQACATLHGKAAEFQNGLAGLEQTVGDVEGVMRSVEENLGRLEVGMVENMEVVRKNMEVLDESLGGGRKREEGE